MLCRRILKRMPREPNALHLMGVVQLINGDRDEAAAYLRRAAANDANNAEVHSNLGSALRACGLAAEAEESFRLAVRLSPSNAQAHFHLGNLLREQNRFEEAVAAYTRAIELSPSYAAAHNNLGAAYESLGRSEEALRLFETAAAIDPRHPEALKNLAALTRRLGRPEKSATHYRAHLSHFPEDAEGRNSLGLVLSELGRHAEAVENFQAAVPDHADALVNLGNALCRVHRPEAALAHFKRALDFEPGCIDTISRLGHAFQQAGRIDEAIDVYERALAEDPANAEANLGAAVAHLSRGEFSAGWRYYLERDGIRGRQRAYHRALLPRQLGGRRILVMRDQGLEDELFFLRFLPLLRERMAWVLYCPDARLTSMLERSNIANRIVRCDGEEPDHDMKISVGDLPFLLGMEDDSPIPAAFPIPVQGDRDRRVKQALLSLGPPPYAGLTWRAATPDWNRPPFKDVPLMDLARALRRTEATLVALQPRPEPGEVEHLADAAGRPVHDMSEMNDDLESMLALLGQIDDYVCVSNTNLHLRASLRKPSRVLVPNPPEFRWMAEGETSPWFPESRIYRQAADGDWSKALSNLESDLSALARRR